MDNEKEDNFTIVMLYLAVALMACFMFNAAYELGQNHCDCKDEIWKHEYKKEADKADSIFNSINEYFLQYEKELNRTQNK